MGVYVEYLNRNMNLNELADERNRQLQRIAQIRGRDVLVYASDARKGSVSVIDPGDILPLQDLLSDLNGGACDIVIETPGGSGEVAEQIVRLLRSKYASVAFIIPGTAKSAGTIMVMSGDEILMGPTSALGPIDAQIQWQGKIFSADALLEGMDKIKQEVEETGKLNRAYIPILQGISPGELQSAENALNFAKVLVTEWLARYKFQSWDRHSSTGEPVTEEDKRHRAGEIAATLCNHREWLTHGRPILMEDLQKMRVIVTDLQQHAKLYDAITRYYTLLQMTMDSSNIYKVFESQRVGSSIYRMLNPTAPPATPVTPPAGQVVNLDLTCNQCGASIPLQANLDAPSPLAPDRIAFPASNRIVCPGGCGMEHDLLPFRSQIEQTTGKTVVA